MAKSSWVAALLAAVLVAPLVAGVPRNVVLIVADDVGRELGCYGHPLAKTPHLDRLAAEGTRFDLAFATTASCSPSRSVLLTGQYNHATGQYGLEHAEHHFSALDRVTSLPARLAQAGYRTARAGKFHVGPAEVYPFSEALAGAPHDPVSLAEACRGFLEAGDARPFLLYFCPNEAHRARGVREDLPGRPNAFGNPPTGSAAPGEVVYDPAQVPVPVWLPDSEASRAEIAEYFQAISRLDRGVGRLLELLDETGRAADTLVIFTSDNGPPFPGAKTTCYEPGLRLPCLIRHPRAARRGVVSQALVSWVDIVPTVLEYAGVPLPGAQARDALHGRSLLPILAEERPAGWDRVWASHTFHEVTMYYPMRVLRERRYKLILNLAHELPFPTASDLFHSSTWQTQWALGLDAPYGRRTIRQYRHRPHVELYDLESDPDELRNLADDPAQSERVQAMLAELRAFQERTHDPWEVKWRYE